MDEFKTGIGNLEDVLVEDHILDKVDTEKYLGDIISVDGKNTKNIAARKAKAVGIVNGINSILQDICFGSFHFEVAVMLRDSLFINSVLVNSECWYGLTENEVTELEKEDEQLLRKVLEAPSKTPKCMLYLETGCKPLRFLIMKRQMMFFHYILKEDKNSLIRRFFDSQLRNPGKNDWVLTIRKNLEELEIVLDVDHIQMTTENQFKTLVEKAIDDKCLEYLEKEKNKKQKVKHIQFDKLEMQNYLHPGLITTHQAKQIFLLRCRMLETKDNYPNKFSDDWCPLCDNGISKDSQQHLMLCPSILTGRMIKANLKYENLFESNVQNQLETSLIILENFKIRKEIIKSRKSSHLLLSGPSEP